MAKNRCPKFVSHIFHVRLSSRNRPSRFERRSSGHLRRHGDCLNETGDRSASPQILLDFFGDSDARPRGYWNFENPRSSAGPAFAKRRLRKEIRRNCGQSVSIVPSPSLSHSESPLFRSPVTDVSFAHGPRISALQTEPGRS